jgi:solute carrier family 26 (sodium-independent sulfate anion transporter), member 11
MMMGIYGMVLGFLKLGFLLEFISLPILSGFISAVAITIILNQMDSLLGEPNVGDGAATQIHDIFQQLPQANGYDCAIGFTCILFLTILDQAGKRWGNKNKVIWILSITRAFLALLLFTGVSYAVNKDRPNDLLFDVAKVKADGQEAPRVPKPDLIAKVASRSIAVFIGAAVEHTAIARAFGVRNNYVTDQSQELCYFGVTNFFNSFFHAMGVGGAMSRTAVNSASKVKSPLSGFVTTAVVLVSIFKLVGTLYWIPKATLAAIIICAVWPLISSPAVFYGYWKASLADFVSSMIAFWVSLFVSTEVGIGASVGFNIVYCLLRQVFARVSTARPSELVASIESARGLPPTDAIPDDTRVFRFTESLFFPNAYAVSTAVLDDVRTWHAPHYRGPSGPETERNWSVVGEQRVARLRRRAGVTDPTALPALGLVVLDFTRVNHVDATGVNHLKNNVKEIRKYGGDTVEIRFAGMSDYVRTRFERCKWDIADAPNNGEPIMDEKVTALYPDVLTAVLAPRVMTRMGTAGTVVEEELMDKLEGFEKEKPPKGRDENV